MKAPCRHNVVLVLNGMLLSTLLVTATVSRSSAAITDGLTVHYKFDEVAGTTLTKSTNTGSDGELFNFPEDNTQWVTGQIGGALQFDGVDDYVIAPDYPLAATSLSVSAWVYASDLPVWGSILKNWGNATVGQFHFGIGPAAAGTLNIFVTQGDGAALNVGTEVDPLPLDSWQHVAFVANEADQTVRLYRNGNMVDEQAYSGDFTPTPVSTALGIGVKTDDSGEMADPGACCPGYWNGRLDDIGLWLRALTPTEITEIYQMGLAGTSLSGGGGGLPGDFNNNGSLDAPDIDALTSAVINGGSPATYDLNGDAAVTDADRVVWVEQLKRSYFGDADLDGQFNSTDLVQVFQVGEYEDATADNSTWTEGDWSGDLDFDSTDFVVAFQGGGFEQGPRPPAVPEPACSALFLLSAAFAFRRVMTR